MSNLIPQYLNVSQQQLEKLFMLVGHDMTCTITGAWNGLNEITIWYRPETMISLKSKVHKILEENN